MSEDEVTFLMKDPSKRHPIWEKAFNEYNTDHPEERPLQMSCRPCYAKVFFHIKRKYGK